MKANRIIFFSFAIFFAAIFGISACKKVEEDKKIEKDKVIGQVQKGPFISGTQILMSELDENHTKTGKIFSSQISNNAGSYEINKITLISSFVEFSANGFYFDEVSGSFSTAQLSLFALSDIAEISTVNVNILTHLEKRRVEYLVAQNVSFTEAKQTAQAEILAIFGFEYELMQPSEALDISVNTTENAVLLAISLILQGNRNAGDLTALLGNISGDIYNDGILSNQNILESLRSSTIPLNLESIRANLVQRYDTLGINASIPDFETWVNKFLVYTSLKPESITGQANNISINSADLEGFVNPGSLSTIVTFEYGLSLEYGDAISSVQSPINGNIIQQVNTTLTDLLPGKLYHYRVKAENERGITYGDDMTFTTLGALASVSTLAATDITITSSMLNGVINPNHLSTIVSFEIGTTVSYGTTISAIQSPVNGENDINVNASPAHLIPGTVYHFRLKAENELGITYGDDMTFKTVITGIIGTVSDVEGNIYPTIGIGYQEWMAENLRTTKYRNGVNIEYPGSDGSAWGSNIVGAYAWYQNDIFWKSLYGALYNWHAVNNSNGLCPTGWHVPSDAEWTILTDFAGGAITAGLKLKSTRTAPTAHPRWDFPNSDATDQYGFSALPAGDRIGDGWYSHMGLYGQWWSSTASIIPTHALHRMIFFNSGEVNVWDGNFKWNGFSVRCVKD